MLDECGASERRVNGCYRLHLGWDDMRLTTAIVPQYSRERRELFKQDPAVFIDTRSSRNHFEPLYDELR